MKTFLLSTFFYTITLFTVSAQTQVGQSINGETSIDRSGFSVDINPSGDFIAIGAIGNTNNNGNFSGHVRVFENINDTWTQVGQDIDGEAAIDTSGFRTSLNGDGSIVAISARLNDGVNGEDSVHVRVFENVNGTWTQIGQDIDGEASVDEFGFSLGISSDGTILAIGARSNDGVNGADSGHVRVFENINGTWTQIGDDIDGENAEDLFGFSLGMSTDGSIIAVGAVGNDDNGQNAGHVRVFENVNGTWTQIGNNINGENSGDVFGGSLSINSDGSILAVGTTLNDENGEDSGEVRVFENVNGTWTQLGQDINGQENFQGLGFSLSINENGTILSIGALENGIGPGKVIIYRNTDNTWIQVGEDINGVEPGDVFGNAVSISADGSLVAVGAFFNNDNGNEAGQVRVFDLSTVLNVEEKDLRESDITLYPNPTRDQITISYSGSELLKEAILIDLKGRHLKEINLSAFNQSQPIDLSTISKGIYFMQITTNTTKFVRKIIIR